MRWQHARKLLRLAAFLLIFAPILSPSELLARDRHRIAILVPTQGPESVIGQDLLNATTMALLDLQAPNLSVTSYDTSGGAVEAANRAISDGAELILGPLFNGEIAAVARLANDYEIPVITFSNARARDFGPNVFNLGMEICQEVRSTMLFVNSNSDLGYATLVPQGEYGDYVSICLNEMIENGDINPRYVIRYARDDNNQIFEIISLISDQNFVDYIFIPDSIEVIDYVDSIIGNHDANGNISFAVTSVSSGHLYERSISTQAVFSEAQADQVDRFVRSYRARFGRDPHALATLAYDAVLLASRFSSVWDYGRNFPTDGLLASNGFTGVSGTFYFDESQDAIRRQTISIATPSRGATSTAQNTGLYGAPQQQPQRVSSHQQTCAQYGFESGSNEFANCVMQLDQAAQMAQAQERQYQLQLQQYQQQMAAYEAQRQELERQRRREETAAFFRGAANGVNSGCRGFLDCLAVGAATELGGVTIPPPPVQPQRPPSIQHYTLRTANGSTVNCTFLAGVNHMDCR